jgi:hypothetical protein
MVSPLTIPATGIWLINYTLRLTISTNGTATMTRYQTWISSSGLNYAISCNAASQALNVSTETCNTGSFVVSVASGVAFALNIDTAYTIVTGGPIGSANDVSYVQFTRIG